MKRRKHKRKIVSKTHKLLILNIVLVCFFMLGIGYSLLNSPLFINGLINLYHWNDPLKIEVTELSTPLDGSNYQYNETLRYKIKVTNNTDNTITAINVVIPARDYGRPGRTEDYPVESLEPDESIEIEREYIIEELDMIDRAASFDVQATGTNYKGKSVNGRHILTVSNVGTYGENTDIFYINIDDDTYSLGDEIDIDITATNYSNYTKTLNLTIGDGITLDQASFWFVSPFSTITTQAHYTVTEKEILDGFINIPLTVSYDSGVSFKNEYHYNGIFDNPDGHLTVHLTTTSTPTNGETYDLEEKIIYKTILENDGNLTITEVVLYDELTNDEWTLDKIAPGERKEFINDYTVEEYDILIGEITNTVVATGTSPDLNEPNVPTDDGEITVPTVEKNAHLTVTIETTNSPSNNYAYELGEDITYKTKVINDGNLTITSIRINQDLTGDYWIIPVLAPGETQREKLEGKYTPVERDIIVGEVQCVVNVVGTSLDPDNPTINASDYVTDPTVDPNPHLRVYINETSSPSNSNGYDLGERINYDIIVENDGNITINDITLTGVLTGDQWTVLSLAPEDSSSASVDYTITEDDILAGEVINRVTATGTSLDPNNPTVTAVGVKTVQTVEPLVQLSASIEIVNEQPIYYLNDVITFNVIYSNEGNLTLYPITINTTGGPSTDNHLAPHATQTRLFIYRVTAADVSAGYVTINVDITAVTPDPNNPQITRNIQRQITTG